MLRCEGVRESLSIARSSIGLRASGAIASLREERRELTTGLGRIRYNRLKRGPPKVVDHFHSEPRRTIHRSRLVTASAQTEGEVAT